VREGSNSLSSQDDSVSISSQLAVPAIDLPQTEGFICPTCMNSYSTPEDLQEHYQSQHVVTSYLCPVCKESFDSAVILDKHFESDHAVKKSQSHDTKDFQVLQNELSDLSASLREEKWYSEEQGREIERLQSLLKTNGADDSDPIKGQLSSMEAAKNALVSEVMLLKRQLTEALDNVATLKREKEKAEEEAKSYALESKDSEDSTQIVKKIMEENEELRSKYENLKIDHLNQISILNDQLTIYGKQNDTDKARVESLSAELVKLKMEIKEQSEEIQFKEQKEIEYMQQNEELSVKAKNSAILIQSHQEDLDKKKTELGHLEQLYLESKRALEEKNIAFETLNSKFREAEGSLIKESEEKDILEKKAQQISQELIEARDTITRLEGERKELLSQIQDGEGASTAIQQLQQESVSSSSFAQNYPLKYSNLIANKC
ncbi:hypothetical protein QYM36_017249, partial [Artemia franciscana]